MKRIYIINGEGLTRDESMGVHRFAKEILKRLDRLIEEDVRKRNYQVWLVIPHDRKLWEAFRCIKVKQYGLIKHGSLSKNLWQQMDFPRFVRKHKGIGIDLTLAIPMRGCGYVALYDCILEKILQDSQSTRAKHMRLFYIFRVKAALKNGAKVITCSENSRRDICSIYRVPKEKTYVIGCGWEHIERIEEDPTILQTCHLEPGKYFFALGSRYYHKNGDWILKEAKKNPSYQFVITGKSFQKEAGEKALDNVIYTGYLSDGQVKALMANAKAFLQPSFYEGFGIPPLEALSLGVPIIVSDRSSLPEIYQGAAHYIDPDRTDYDLDQVLAQPVSASETILNRYTWKQAAEDFYQNVLRQV